VYFHNATKKEIAAFYQPAISELQSELDEVQQAFREKKLEYDQYEKKRLYLANKKKQLERDAGSLAIARDSLRKIEFSGGKLNPRFEESVYTDADSTPFGHSAHADPDTCSTAIRTGSRSAATQGLHC